MDLCAGDRSAAGQRPNPVGNSERNDVALIYNLRTATVQDVGAVARLHVETFRQTHGGGPSVEIRASQWAQILNNAPKTDFTFLAEEPSGAAVGFARGALHDGAIPGFEGRLNKLYVLNAHQGNGLGKLLVGSVASRFLEIGISSMLLFGDARSRANGFFEHLGAERLLDSEGRFHGGYGWQDLDRLVDTCSR